MVSKTAGSLGDCKGKRLATDHFDDPKFIEKVVAAGAFKPGDFTVVTTKRFGEAGRKIISGDADCALIDDAQLADVIKLDAARQDRVGQRQAPPHGRGRFPRRPRRREDGLPGQPPQDLPGQPAGLHQRDPPDPDLGHRRRLRQGREPLQQLIATGRRPEPPVEADLRTALERPAKCPADDKFAPGGPLRGICLPCAPPGAIALALALASLTTACCLVPASGPPQASLADVAVKGDALAISDALEALVAEGKDTPSDREFALNAIRPAPRTPPRTPLRAPP